MKPRKDKKSPDEMTFLEHLEDLRKRLFYIFIAVFAAVIPCWIFAKDLYQIIARPVTQYLPAGTKLAFTHLTAPFMLYMKIAFLAALIFTSPYVFLQIWYFVAPGLYQKEKKYVFPFVFFTTVFFIPGILFGYYLVFPWACRFFLQLGSDFQPVITVDQYFTFALRVLLGIGARLRAPDPRLFPVQDRRHHRPLDGPELQVRRPGHLRHRRRHHADAGHDHPEHRGRPDDRPLRARHPHRPRRGPEQGAAAARRGRDAGRLSPMERAKRPALVGLTGTNGAGKGEAAAYLGTKGYGYLSLSDVLREELAARGLAASRDNLIAVGNELRARFGPDVLARRTMAKVLGPTVIDSIRNPREVDYLRRQAGSPRRRRRPGRDPVRAGPGPGPRRVGGHARGVPGEGRRGDGRRRDRPAARPVHGHGRPDAS